MGTSEIEEAIDGSDSESKRDESAQKIHVMKSRQNYSIQHDINKLFEAIDIRNSHRGLGQPNQAVKDASLKRAMKRPIRVVTPQAPGVNSSEPVNLKQALRGLCISQASEMAAMKKRLSRPSRLSGVSEAGRIKRSYTTLVVEASGSGDSLNKIKGNVVEISLVEEGCSSNFLNNRPEFESISKVDHHDHDPPSFHFLADAFTQKLRMAKLPEKDEANSSSVSNMREPRKTEPADSKKLKLPHPSISNSTDKKLPVVDEVVPSTAEVPIKLMRPDKEGSKLQSSSFSSGLSDVIKRTKPSTGNLRLIKPVLRSKSYVKKKLSPRSTSISSSSKQSNGGVGNRLHSSTGMVEDERGSPATSNRSARIEISSNVMDSSACKPALTSSSRDKTISAITKADDGSRSREKGEISQSSKSSIGDYSSTTSFSEDSYLSGSSRSGHRPHMSKDLRWEAIHSILKQHGHLGLRHFKLLRKLGGGDIGSVYLSELIGTSCLFAVKVMDNGFLASRKKIVRAETEKEILQVLDHPFLPTLYAHFTTDKFSCLVMEYCPGGDLHVLRQKQPGKCFSEQAVRFYVAEVLLALEYLHMLGVVYRDLKPENILIREDGHIMLTDFDLSLRCSVKPTLLKSASPVGELPKKMSSPCSESSCIHPFCLDPSWQVSCFTPSFLSATAKTRKLKSELAAQLNPLPQLVVEPTSARSNSFVGTHEYLAPEIIRGEGHGSAVDWWTFGIFTHELLYGKTPFKGTGNEETLSNVVSQRLNFPESPMVSSQARDLIRQLLQKEPHNRLGSEKGAAEIKQHPFFEGLNLALIRCTTPPELPRVSETTSVISDIASQNHKNSRHQKEFKSTEEVIEFEMF